MKRAASSCDCSKNDTILIILFRPGLGRSRCTVTFVPKVASLSGQLKLEPRSRFVSFSGFIRNFRRASPSVLYESLPGNEQHLFMESERSESLNITRDSIESAA